MPTPFESAQLNLKLFELRREPVLREARAWVTRDFNPETPEEMMAALQGEHNTRLRMVYGYWDMAASLVTTGAIDADAFRAAHSEIVGAFSKIQPFLPQLRAAMELPDLFRNMETVVMTAPDAAGRLERTRKRLRDMATARRGKAETQA